MGKLMQGFMSQLRLKDALCKPMQMCPRTQAPRGYDCSRRGLMQEQKTGEPASLAGPDIPEETHLRV
jgi:hypothetical protein